MSMYPDIGGNASAPNAPGFNLNFDEKQPPYAPYQPPPPYSGPGYPGVPMPQAQPQPQPPTIVIQQPDRRQEGPTVVIDKFPSKSINIKCMFCHEDIKTRIEARSNICTYLLCTFLCFIG
ncbi:hypothetical protein QR98_0054110 [Sarcoptes scabiei]|nr:hypothetical protein QR98_0054110 [Sarcoptes scabiei]